MIRCCFAGLLRSLFVFFIGEFTVLDIVQNPGCIRGRDTAVAVHIAVFLCLLAQNRRFICRKRRVFLHCKFRIIIGHDAVTVDIAAEIAEHFDMAVFGDIFQRAGIFVDQAVNIDRYRVNPGLDALRNIKIVCNRKEAAVNQRCNQIVLRIIHIAGFIGRLICRNHAFDLAVLCENRLELRCMIYLKAAGLDLFGLLADHADRDILIAGIGRHLFHIDVNRLFCRHISRRSDTGAEACRQGCRKQAC